jgi:hypothetical protein
MRNASVVLLAGSVLLAASCDAVVDAGYEGEPLFQVHGVVTSERTDLADGAKLALVWVRFGINIFNYPHDASVKKVRGSFPSSFEMPLFDPPDDDMLMSMTHDGQTDGARVAVAYLLVYKADAVDLSNVGSIIGAAQDEMVVYVEGTIQPGSQIAQFVHGELSPGYHLMKVVRRTPAEIEAIRTCWSTAATSEEIDACGSILDQLLPIDDAQRPTVTLSIPRDQASIDTPQPR